MYADFSGILILSFKDATYVGMQYTDVTNTFIVDDAIINTNALHVTEKKNIYFYSPKCAGDSLKRCHNQNAVSEIKSYMWGCSRPLCPTKRQGWTVGLVRLVATPFTPHPSPPPPSTPHIHPRLLHPLESCGCVISFAPLLFKKYLFREFFT
jgi:hypothetical protein